MFTKVLYDLKDKWIVFRHWVDRNIGQFEEVSLKHRSAVILLSVLVFFVEPDVKLEFGSAAFAGLGVSVDPPQTIPVGLVLLSLLIYRFVAFWFTIFLMSGTDENIAIGKALYEDDPAWNASGATMSDYPEMIKDDAEKIVYKWRFRKFIWEVMLPSVAALVVIFKYAATHLFQLI